MAAKRGRLSRLEIGIVKPFDDVCGAGVIDAQPCPRQLRRELPVPRRRIVLAACVLASSMAFIAARYSRSRCRACVQHLELT